MTDSGNPYYVGNVETLSGETGAVTEGLLLTYAFKDSPDEHNDALAVETGQVFLTSQDGKPRMTGSGHEEDYRIVASSVIFGALGSGSSGSTPEDLMTRLLSFLSKESAVDNADAVSPGLFELKQNYPNPFNGVTTFEGYIDVPGSMTISIISVHGRMMKQIQSDYYQPGHFSISLNFENLPSGFYLVSFNAAGGRRMLRKVVLQN